MIGKTIRLRAMELSDKDTIYNWENDPRTWEFGYRKWPVSMDDVAALIAQSDQDIWQTRQMRLMVETLSDAKTVGCVDLYDFSPHDSHCALAIFIQEPDRRKGYASEAISLMAHFATRTLRAHSILAEVAADNAGSISLFRALGFQEAGRLLHWTRNGDQFQDLLLFQSILR